jgi:hypothetical protein
VAPGPAGVAAVRLTVCDHDAKAHWNRRPVFHVLGGAPTPSEALEKLPEDCTKPCWRHVDGGGQCECGGDDESGTTEGGW